MRTRVAATQRECPGLGAASRSVGAGPRPTWTALLVLIGCAAADPAGAQVTKVEKKQDLRFGDVWTGTTKTLTPASSDAAVWFIEANEGTVIALSFGLPSNLVSGANLLPITFSSSSAAWKHDSSPTGQTTFDPATGAQVTVSATRQVYVWLGGSISPPYGQAAGDYAAAITLIVTTN